MVQGIRIILWTSTIIFKLSLDLRSRQGSQCLQSQNVQAHNCPDIQLQIRSSKSIVFFHTLSCGYLFELDETILMSTDNIGFSYNFLGVKQYNKCIVMYCNTADPYCNTYCNMLYMTFCISDHL